MKSNSISSSRNFIENIENCGIRTKQTIPGRSRTFGTDLTNVNLSSKPCKSDVKNLKYLNEYIVDIYENLHQTEADFLPRPGYMSIQLNINEKMRAILIDWLVEVHHKFKLSEETLFLTVNILDRYLEKTQVDRENLQLVGISSMLIACKYEEIYPPEIKEFIYVTDNAYIQDQVLEAENSILRCLNFNLTTPSSFRFLQRYSRVCEFDEYAFNLSRYIIELSLTEYKLIKYKPSNIAAAAIALTQKILKNFSRTLKDLTPCTDSEVRLCAKDLGLVLQKAETCSLQAVRKKFMHLKFLEVAKIQLKL
jgi:G2/mitotic-specific cyclin-B, other